MNKSAAETITRHLKGIIAVLEKEVDGFDFKIPVKQKSNPLKSPGNETEKKRS